MSDTLRGRLAIHQHSADGYIDNAFLNRDDTDDRDEFASRAKLQWLVGPGRDVRLNVSYADIDNGYDAFSLENSRNTRTDRPGFDRQKTVAIGISSDWAINESLQFQALLSWTNADEDYGFDEDWVFAGFCDGRRCDPLVEFNSTDIFARDRDVLAADFRFKSQLGQLNWVIGAYAQHRDESLDREHFGSFASDYETERWAIYGQVQAEIGAQWVFTGGFRYEHFDDEYSDTNGLSTDNKDDYWTGELSAEFRINDDSLVYATLARGVKPGGINTDTSSNLPIVAPTFTAFLSARQRFSTETLFNKELGLKTHLFDRRLALRAALFHMDRTSAQLESFVFDPNTFIFTSFLDSSSDAESYGMELEIDYQVNPRIRAFANIGYLETNVDQLMVFDLDTLQFRLSRNRDQAKSPQWTYQFGLLWQLGERWRGRIELEGRDESFFGYYHDGKIDAYARANANVNYHYGRTTVGVWVRNLFDTNYDSHGLYFANDPRDGFAINRTYVQRGEPRVFGVKISYAY